MSLVKRLPPEEREVPHEPGNSMSFRPLSGMEIEEAQADNLRDIGRRFPKEAIETFASLRTLQIADDQKSIEMTRGEDGEWETGRVDVRARDREAPADPLTGYSVRTLLRHGLAGWSGAKYDGQETNDEAKDQLDAVTRRWAALQVLDASVILPGEAPSSAPGSSANGTELDRPAVFIESGQPS